MGIEVFALSSFERLVWLAVWGQLGVLPKGLALLRHYTCLSPPPFLSPPHPQQSLGTGIPEKEDIFLFMEVVVHHCQDYTFHLCP